MKKFNLNKQQIIKCISIPIVLLILQLGISSNNNGAGGNTVNGCSCHGVQSNLTLLTLTGIPTAGYLVGQTYTLTATVTNTAKTKAGFNIAANVGSIAAGTGTTVSGLDITHNGGKLMTSGVASWTFQWTAPATGSSATFTFAGNATNNDGGTGGDAWAKQPFTFNAATVITTPTITSITTTGITTSSANGSASVNANGASTAITIEYGTTTSYGSTTAATPNTATGTMATTITYSFTGLLPATIYHYRIKTVNSAGTTTSADQIFTTLTAVAVPTITNINTTNITFTSAIGTADINANLGSTTATIEYGTTTSYGSSTTATPSTVTGSSNTPITFPFTGLTQNTQYHYRIKAVNSAGTTTSADQKFTTLGTAINDVNKIAYSIYPNPCVDQLTIKAENCQQYRIKLVAVNGTEIAINPVISANSIQVQTAAIANGNYIISLHSKSNTYSYPVVIKH